MPDPQGTLGHELLKLLLQVAWADHEIQPEERALLVRLSERFGLSDAELERIWALLDGAAPLPPPDLGLLRRHREEVMDAVEDVVMADAKVLPDEQAILQQIEELLAGG